MTGSRIAEEARYRLAADTIGSAERAAMRAVIESGYMTMGENVRRFETEFATWVGSPHAVMVNSGSSANLLIVDALLRGLDEGRLAPGDEVLVPGLSWPTTVWPIAQLGLVPVFCDVDPDSLAIDLHQAALALGSRMKAMFLIHPLGRAVNSATYAQFCRNNGLLLIEDSCESLGAHSRGRHVGTVGLAGSFSSYFSHHISTIEGGVIVTNDPALADTFRSLRAHGWIRDRSDRESWATKYPTFDPRFLFATVGYNVRPMELQAAIGLVQLDRLEGFLVAREALASQVNEIVTSRVPWLRLIGADCLATLPTSRRDRVHSWMTLPFRVSRDAPLSRDQVVNYLESMGVETRPLIAGNLARHPAVLQVPHRIAGDLSNCDALLADTFMIGCHPEVTEARLQTLLGSFDALGEQ